MKKLIVFLLAAVVVKAARAQITLEQTYPSNGYFNSISTPNNYYGGKLFYLVKLETSGEKYVAVDLLNQSINFYNLNHSLYTTMSYSNITLLAPPNVSVSSQKMNAQLLYISERLFDTDNQIELMYTYYYVGLPPGPSYVITQIVNQDGSIMFTANDEIPYVRPTYHNQYYPIYNTVNGTKMILSKTDGSAKVYSLGGTFTAMLTNNNISANDDLMSLAPNPSAKGGVITLNYDLPAEISTAVFTIYDNAGKEIKSYKIGNDMHQVLIEQGELPAGVYHYSLLSGSKVIGSKKSVVIE